MRVLKRFLKKLILIFRSTTFPASLSDSTIIHSSARILNSSNNPSLIRIGSRTHVYGTLMVWENCGSIVIGDDCFIGEGSRLYSSGCLKIGSRVLIAHSCNIFDSNIHSLCAEERHAEFIQNTTSGLVRLHDIKSGFITIEDDVWIGASVIILKNVVIGKCSIVGAGSVVVKDIPPYSIAVGNPASIIKMIQPNISPRDTV